ncbi:MAG: hypothetical protein SF052_16130 [Bacteroidia bacterium]|nr:hypothetical protein [Bacteroidia bacterium]
MKKNSYLILFGLCIMDLFTGCGSFPQPDCSGLTAETIRLIPVGVNLMGIAENEGYYHRLVVDDYSDGCFRLNGLIHVAYHYIDTVKTYRPICGVFFYDSTTPFENEEGEEDDTEIANSLLVGFTLKTPYDSIESRSFDGIMFSRGGYQSHFQVKGIAWEKK